ncbi:hypothetical protein [Kitasatospora sp. NPDC058218]|uniref:hypothetical protein n=1 Tax=Kitasatospora sp. NPDC058218 TaxID=3346385 RepID=UPI0036DBEDAD
MPFDVYTAMGALVRAEASRTVTPVGAAAPPTAHLPAGSPEFGEEPVARAADRAQHPSAAPRRLAALPSALRRLAARLG